MPKGISNTQRTLKYVRETLGWKAEICERWIINPKIPSGGFHKDLFGILDVIAMSDTETIGIQSCGQAFADHDKTIMESPNSVKWLKAGNKLMLIGWRKILRERGGKLKVWAPRIKEYKIEDF
jgi:hypothetical protein